MAEELDIFAAAIRRWEEDGCWREEGFGGERLAYKAPSSHHARKAAARGRETRLPRRPGPPFIQQLNGT